MNCQKCGKDIPEQIDYCPSCKINEMRKQSSAKVGVDSLDKHEEQILVEEENKQTDCIISNSNKWATISLIMSLIPMIFILLFPFIRPFFASVIKYPQLLWFYRLVSLLPIIAIIIAFTYGIKGLNSEKKSLAIIALINSTLLLLAVLVFGL